MLKERLSLTLTLLLLVLMVAAAWAARGFGALAAYFPLSVATFGAIIAGIEIILLRTSRVIEDPDEETHLRMQIRGGLRQIAWLGLYLVSMMGVGFFTTTAAYLALTLWKGAGYRLPQSLALAAAACVFLYVFGHYVALAFPSGLIDGAVFSALDL